MNIFLNLHRSNRRRATYAWPSWTWSVGWLGFCLCAAFSCGKTDLIPTIISIDETTIVPPILASIQPKTTDQAELIIKAGFEFGPADWRITMLDAGGRSLSLNAGSVSRLELFNLIPYQAAGLLAGQTYHVYFATRNAGGDSVTIDRIYTHRPDGPRWIRRAHTPSVGGDFAGSALSTDNVPKGDDADYMSVWRYQNDQRWQTLSYNVVDDSWYSTLEYKYMGIPRHGIVRFKLQAAGGVIPDFSGLGFVTNELLPGQRQYLKDMVVPAFAGPDGEVRWFATLKRAYQLVEGGPSQMWVRWGTWDQYRAPDLPEPTGTLATFRIGTTGYVINQRPGLPIHLWAFDTEREQWSRLADFPGTLRSRGIGFQAGGKGYFGLGINARQETLRDVWAYDPTNNQWTYATDYPGAGSIYLIVGQLPEHTLLGWGYEQQPTAAGGIRLVGCTDLWEFKP